MTYDIIIIGGGIVGLATALRIKEQNPDLKLALLEKEIHLSAHQTGHNSGVIHSGVYYKPGSLKATNCIQGYRMLLDFCDAQDIPYDLCGKVIVATRPEEIAALNTIQQRGEENGLEGLRRLNRTELQEHEPHVDGREAIFVPQTGIIDYTAVALRYADLIREKDGDILLGEKVTDIQIHHHDCTVVTSQGSYTTRLVINCAGLYSDKIAQMTQAAPIDIKIIPFRGEYYEIRKEKEHLVNNLIYPVPDPNFPFLGVHFTRMIGGGVEAGPNAVLAFRREGYRKADVDVSELSETLRWPGFQRIAKQYWQTGLGEMHRSFSKAAFTEALQKLVPAITEDDLLPGEAGVRAQACDRHGGLLDDFLIIENEFAVNVCNAPSPAATSSLSIGQTVAERVLKRFDVKVLNERMIE